MSTRTIDAPERIAFEGVRRLSVQVLEGSVDVIGTDGDATVVEVGVVGEKQLDLRYENGSLAVRHDADWSRGPAFWLEHTRPRFHTEVSITVPRHCEVEVSAVLAEVVVSGVEAPVRVRTANKALTLAALTAGVDAETVDGAMRASDIGGEARLHSVSGDITLVKGPLIRLDAVSVSGTITVDLDEPVTGEFILGSTTGDLTVRIPADSDLEADLETTLGDLVCGFPELQLHKTFGLKTVNGVLGSGRGSLRAHSVTGSVALLRRDADGIAPADGSAPDPEEAL